VPRRLLLLVLLLAVAISASSQWHWSATYDEPHHLWMGQRILQDGDFSRFDNSKMPVSVFNAATWIAWQSITGEGSWFAARLPQVGWLLGTALVVFAWSRERRGAWAALGAASLVALDPNLLAHASVVTTDLPCTFFVLLASWTWWRALKRPTTRNHLIAGGVLGLAQAAKFTAIFLLPIHALIALGWCLAQRSAASLRKTPLTLLAALLALNTAYCFEETGTPASEIAWQSSIFAPLADSALPLPVPRPWIEGLDWVKADDDRGHGNIYSHGVMTPEGQSPYYLLALARKGALPLMLLGLLGILRRRPRAEDLAVVVPPLFLLAWFSLAFNFQLGLRYLLPLFPFLAIWAAQNAPRLLGVGVAWTLVSGLSWWPWTLSYFNETLPVRHRAWEVLADSNLDWGQAQHVASQWQQENPGGLVDPDVPAIGSLLLSANVLTGVLGDPGRHACIREHLAPSTHLAYALYPLELSADDLEACFPRVAIVGGEGRFPGGTHLLVLRFRQGSATLEVGDSLQRAESSGSETLLGLLVDAAAPFDASWTLPEEGQAYLNGIAIAP
jgi:4-amino-4-deoxy-L-arabinose transferase-like glycosyltransferase